jgi:hypothetical protein
LIIVEKAKGRRAKGAKGAKRDEGTKNTQFRGTDKQRGDNQSIKPTYETTNSNKKHKNRQQTGLKVRG